MSKPCCIGQVPAQLLMKTLGASKGKWFSKHHSPPIIMIQEFHFSETRQCSWGSGTLIPDPESGVNPETQGGPVSAFARSPCGSLGNCECLFPCFQPAEVGDTGRGQERLNLFH